MGNGSSENVTETLSLYEYKMEMFPNWNDSSVLDL